MGGGLSFIASADIRADWKEVFSEMELNNADVQKLNKVFSTFLNADSKGVVKISKALDLLEIDKSRFNEKIFLTFDKDNTRCIDLYAFVVSLWKFCCLQRVAINAFVFEIYDTDKDGRITTEQIEKMFLELFGTKGMEQEANKNSLAECLKMTNFEGKMNMNGFQKFCKTRQVLLSPVINTQQALMAATLGTAGWELVASRTLEVYPGRNITIRELLALHNDREMFKELLNEASRELAVTETMRTVLRNSVHQFYRTLPKRPPPIVNPTAVSRKEGVYAQESFTDLSITPPRAESPIPGGSATVLTPTGGSGSGSGGSSKRSRNSDASIGSDKQRLTSILKVPPKQKSAAPVRRTVLSVPVPSGAGGPETGSTN